MTGIQKKKEDELSNEDTHRIEIKRGGGGEGR